MRMPFLALLILVCSWASYSHAGSASLRQSLFSDAEQALATANDSRASLLAPTSYAEGADFYRRAEALLEDGGDIDSIGRYLKKATQAFESATAATAVAQVAFRKTLEARADAQQAEAPSYAAEAWRAAEVGLADAAVRLEKDRVKSAQRAADSATELFRTAELTAIKANYLDRTRQLLAQADDLKAPRYAPNSFAQATKLLAEAETALETDRYDTDRPRNLAQLAEHAASHAVYVSELEIAIRKKKTSLEQVLTDWEASISRIADQVDVPVFFDNGPEQAEKDIRTAVGAVLVELEPLRNTVRDREEQIAALELELGSVQRQLGGTSKSMERLNDLMASQANRRQKISTVEGMFRPEQAIVLRQGDNIILRMVGLSFDSGSATLKTSHYALLGALQKSIGEFPNSDLVVEGHTDAYGSDADNLNLSHARAEAVLQYLLANAAVDPKRITAQGFGESNPVANNETPEGRARNRRIDVVIYPRWEVAGL